MRTHLLPPRTSPRRSVQGFTIIEIMVGLVIGLLTLLAIYQLFAVSEGRRRTVVAVTQAQSAGAMALFSIDREIRSAGLGFASLDPSFLGCKVRATNTARSTPEFDFPFQPVVIKDGKEIWVLSGSSSNMFVGARFSGSQNGEFKMGISNAGMQAGDILVGTNDANTDECLMMEVTKGAGDTIAMPGGTTESYQGVEHRATSYTSFYTGANVGATHNGSYNNMLDVGATSLGEGWLFNLGPKPTLSVWKVTNQQLTRYDYLEGTDTASKLVAQDVLQMVAEYGYDADGSGKIDQSGEWAASTPSAPHLDKLIAMRVAVLVRSSQYEKDEVTPLNPRWASGSKEFDMSAIDPTGDWKHFRYRVYESVIPLRNTIWGQMK